VGPFEYLLLFLSIVLGLAVADLCISLNRLLDAGARVKWDWLTPLAATVAFLKIVTQWWSWFNAAPLAKAVTFEMFVALLVTVVLLYLIAAVALPDSVDAGADLRAYYARTSRRYWLLFAGQFALSNAVSIWVQMQAAGARLAFSPGYLILPAAIALAFVRNRLVHTAAFCGLIAIYLLQFAGHGLGQ
jgi:low temperature requirement protein LtrA